MLVSSLVSRNYNSCGSFFPHGLIWPQPQIPHHPPCAASSCFALPEAVVHCMPTAPAHGETRLGELRQDVQGISQLVPHRRFLLLG